jgi:large subunit ribosomal protein L10
LNRDEKVSIVEEFSDKFSKAKIAILSDYRGLTVSDFEELRVSLKKCGSEIKVAKNTLLKRAAAGTAFESLSDQLNGTTALTLSFDDPVGPAKVLADFAKEHEQLQIKGAVLEGKPLATEDLIALSKLPSKDVLLATMLSCMQAVPTSFVRVLNAIPQKMVYMLQAIKDQKEQ